MAMTNFEWTERVTGDDDTVDRMMHDGSITPQTPSIGDLLWCAEWLSTYPADDDPDTAQMVANVIGYLVNAASAKESRAALAAAKRAYAEEHGIKVSQVRLRKEN